MENSENFSKPFWRSAWFWLVVTGVIIILIIVLIFMFKNSNKNNSGSLSKNDENQQNQTNKETSTNIIKNIGVNLDYYNSATGKAGDFKFFKIQAPYDRIFTDFGYVIKAENTADKRESANPHPTFILPLGTEVMALIDGVVVDVPKLYSDDYSIQMSPDGSQNGLIFELEHVKNPLVKKGDKVVAGQKVAEVTDFGSHNYSGYGSVDIAVLQAGTPPRHLCPFLYLDNSIKDDVYAKIRAFYSSWEEYVGNNTIYSENSYSIPGCESTDPIEG